MTTALCFGPSDVELDDDDERQVTCPRCRDWLGYDPLPDTPPAVQALALVMEYGHMLAQKDEWDMDDNFNTTEALYALYCDITGWSD